MCKYMLTLMVARAIVTHPQQGVNKMLSNKDLKKRQDDTNLSDLLGDMIGIVLLHGYAYFLVSVVLYFKGL